MGWRRMWRSTSSPTRTPLDSRIVRFLDIYADLSDHLTLEYTDPTVYPSALTEYGVEAGHRGGHLRRHRPAGVL